MIAIFYFWGYTSFRHKKLGNPKNRVRAYNLVSGEYVIPARTLLERLRSKNLNFNTQFTHELGVQYKNES